MKNLILVICVLFGFNAFAQQDIVSYEFGMRTGKDYTSTILKTVKVNSEGMLIVESTPLTVAGSSEKNKVTSTKELHEKTFSTISSMVSTLSHHKVVRRYSDVVCMLAVPLEDSFDHLSTARDYDWKSGTYLSPIELVHGPQGCWVGASVYFEQDRANIIAVRLKSMLQVLALELL